MFNITYFIMSNDYNEYHIIPLCPTGIDLINGIFENDITYTVIHMKYI